MSHCRLIYHSVSSERVMTNKDLRALVEQCSRNNSRENITGLLILSGGEFLQALEGPSKSVNRLFRKIMFDKRHYDISLVSYEQIGPSYFGDWSTHLMDLYDLPMPPRQFLMHKYEHQGDVIQIPNKLHTVFSLLLDARSLCLSKPWNERS